MLPIYIILSIITAIVLDVEIREMNCPHPNALDSECGFGKAGLYVASIPNDNDDIPTLLDKIDIASDVLTRTIYWRRSYILSIIITLALWIMLFRKMPNGYELLFSILLIMFILYFSCNFYSFHHYGPPKIYIDKSTKLIRKKL